MPFTVTVTDPDQPADSTFRCSDATNALEGMERSGSHAVPVGCRRGGCGVCRVQITDGTYSALRMSKAHVSEADLAHGVVLLCRVLPTSDLKIRVLHPATAAS